MSIPPGRRSSENPTSTLLTLPDESPSGEGVALNRFVAVTADRRPLGPAHGGPRTRPARPEVWVGEVLVRRLRAVGLEPLLLPPLDGDPTALIDEILGVVGGVVIPGGAFDIHPRHYGAAITLRLDSPDEGRTRLELGLARACLERDVPLLGLCGGMQAMVVAAGGTLHQDIAAELPGSILHEQPTDPSGPWHSVRLLPSRLREAYGGAEEIEVNSTHHQAVDQAGELIVTGRAPDGVVEAVEHSGRCFCVGVQWHPELLDGALFMALAAALGV